MGTLSNLRLLLWTARYLKPSQIWYRCNRNLYRWFWQVSSEQAPRPSHWQFAPCGSLYAGLPDISSAGPWKEEVSRAVKRASDISGNRFCFLNHTVEFAGEPQWHDPNVSKLWRFHLHYFSFLDNILVWSAAGQGGGAYDAFKDLIGSWIDSNQTLAGDGWHPHTLSERLVNWIQAVSVFDASLKVDQPFQNYLLSSLYGQARFLYDNLEFDIRGNHLVKNLRGLLWAGLAFKGSESERWVRQATDLLEKELTEQLLGDGGHFERNPGYHSVVLKDCLEIGLWLRRNNHLSPQWLNDGLRRMLDYLVAILPLDGRLPLLKDTSWDSTPSPSDLLAAGALYFNDSSYKRSAEFGLYPLLLFGLSGWESFKDWGSTTEPRNSVALGPSGYYIMRDETRGDQLTLDAGKPCPGYLPAHAHADLLSYELMANGQRVVVDSGVYEYSGGPWRDYFRSTRAHNTVEVEGQNQSEVWSSFRVARRARPGTVLWKQTDSSALLQAAHDGYRRLPAPVIHRRTVLWRKGRFWLFVDELWGQGSAAVAGYVHLHPTISLEDLTDSCWSFRGSHSPLWLTSFGQERCSIFRGQMHPIRQGWYSEQFGELQPNTVLTMHQSGDLPLCHGYVISKQYPLEISVAQTSTERRIVLRSEEYENTLLIPRNSVPQF